jgi:hypothetical protein
MHLQAHFKVLATLAICTVMTNKATAQSAKDIRGVSPLITVENEAPPKLIVDPPLPEPLAAGRVFIQYRTENLRVLPVFGEGALTVSPRLGHIYITVDDASRHFVVPVERRSFWGAPCWTSQGSIELADPTHTIMTSETVRFTVPSRQKKQWPNKQS